MCCILVNLAYAYVCRSILPTTCCLNINNTWSFLVYTLSRNIYVTTHTLIYYIARVLPCLIVLRGAIIALIKPTMSRNIRNLLSQY